MALFYLIIGIGFLLLLLSVARWYASAPSSQVMFGLRWLAMLGGGAAATWLVLSGRAMQSLYLLIAFLPFARRWWAQRRGATQSPPHQSSDVETPWLHMRLDHDTGTMDGLILQGDLKGRKLSELSAAQLLDLLGDLRITDRDSAALLESYLDAVHGGWRDARDEEPQPAGAGGGEMTRDEARRILGVSASASEDEILQAWRALMKRNHPDQGGSAYLAAQINKAKETLLG
jgi:hypothetical protein